GYRVIFTPDGRRVVTTGLVLKEWDLETGREVAAFRAPGGYAVYSPDGRHATSSADEGETVLVWKLGALERPPQGFRGPRRWPPRVVRAGAYRTDGLRLATGGEDGVVRVWEAETAKELVTLSGHTSTVLSLAFTRDGRRLASGGADKTVRIW